MPSRLEKVWNEHNLSIVTLTLFLIITAALLWPLGWHRFVSDQVAHQQPVTLSEYLWWWMGEYWMSLVADVFGGLYLILATKRLHEKDSAQGG